MEAQRNFFVAHMSQLLYTGKESSIEKRRKAATMNNAMNTKAVPESYRDLLERPLMMVLGTTMPDGTSRVTPIWFSYEDGCIYVNSVRDSAKHRAIQAHPYVSMVVIDSDNPFRYLAMRGPVIEMNEEDANEHNDRLAMRYLGLEKFPWPHDEPRVLYKIALAHVATKG